MTDRPWPAADPHWGSLVEIDTEVCGVFARVCETCAEHGERIEDGDDLMARCAAECRHCAALCREVEA